MPHLRAAVAFRAQLVLDLNDCPHQVARRAEGCTATRALSWPLLPLSSERFTQTFPQIPALVRGPSKPNSTLLRLHYRPTASYAARRGVPDCSHSRSVPHPLRKRNTSYQSRPIVPHLRAALVYRTQRAPGPDGPSYQVSQHARTCMAVYILIWSPLPLSTEQPVPTSPKSAAATRSLSYLDQMRARSHQTPSRILALRRDAHSSSRARSVLCPGRAKDSSFQSFSRTPQWHATLAIGLGMQEALADSLVDSHAPQRTALSPATVLSPQDWHHLGLGRFPLGSAAADRHSDSRGLRTVQISAGRR